MGRRLASCAEIHPRPRSQAQLNHPLSAVPPNALSTLGCPSVARRAGFAGSGAHVARRPLSPGDRAAKAVGSRPGTPPGWGGGSHFPSPTAAGAGAAGRGRQAGRVLWTRPRGPSCSRSGGSSRAAAGAAPSRAPLPPRAPGRRPARPAHAASRAGELRPRHGSLRCVGGPGPCARASPPAVWPPAALRALPAAGSAAGAGLCASGSSPRAFCSFPLPRRKPPVAAFPRLPSRPVARFSSVLICTSPVPRLLSLLLSLRHWL